MFCKGRPPEKQQKINKISMKNNVNFEWKKTGHEVAWKVDLGGSLAQFWEDWGSLWAGFWPLLGAFCLPFGRSRPYLFQALLQNELQEAFWMDFGLLLEGFGKVLGGFWEGFEWIWEDLGAF